MRFKDGCPPFFIAHFYFIYVFSLKKQTTKNSASFLIDKSKYKFWTKMHLFLVIFSLLFFSGKILSFLSIFRKFVQFPEQSLYVFFSKLSFSNLRVSKLFFPAQRLQSQASPKLLEFRLDFDFC